MRLASILSVLTAFLLAAVLQSQPAEAHPIRSLTADPTPSWRNQCAVEHQRLWRVWHARVYSRYAYRQSDYGREQRVRLRALAKCQHSHRARVHAARIVHRERQARVKRLRARGTASGACGGITPYPGGGACWAVPHRIVLCESHGSWSAYNPSGAAGPYQIMPMWGRPWPISGPADREAHHRIAAHIWSGGAGAGNWVCR